MIHAAMITANQKKAATRAAFFHSIAACLTNVEVRTLQDFRGDEYQQLGSIIDFDC